MKYFSRYLLVVCRLMIGIVCISNLLPVTSAHAQQPVVRAVLFFSPTCGHCKRVVEEVLPPLISKYSGQLQIIGIDISQQGGLAMYQATVNALKIPQNRLGVPTLIIDSLALVGEDEIANQFPALIEEYLAKGGVDWPAIPGLDQVLARLFATPTATLEPLTPTPTSPPPTATPQPTPTPTPIPGWMFWMQTPQEPGQDLLTIFKQDSLGNTITVAVLGIMLLALILMIPTFWRPTTDPSPAWKALAIPILAIVGMGIAGYMTYVESTQTLAVCGPVGDCNAVQQSEYARLFGILPIGMLGLLGYGMILIAWALSRIRVLRKAAALALLFMALVGVLFSIYLTFLEPFVIGAACAWCLTSAIVMTALFVLAVPYAWSMKFDRSLIPAGASRAAARSPAEQRSAG